MAFGDEDLMELRAQLIGAGRDPQAARGQQDIGLGLGTEAVLAAGVGHDQPPSRRASNDRLLAASEVTRSDRSSSAGPAASPSGPPLGDSGERDEFLAMLGHELRNPLATLLTSVELLQAHADPQDPEYLQQVRIRLARQVEHLSRLVDVLLGGNTPPAAGSEAAAAVALVRRVVEMHGGRVTTRDGGPGTELRVWLPAAPPEVSSAGSLPVAPAARPRRILVVDDNEDAAEMLALVLRKRGYTVVLAFDGEEALTMAQAHQPDVILLDIGLPGIDGYEVARRLRARPTPERPVLVAVTGYGQPADRQRSREAGFDHHLVKPVAMEKLLPLLI